MTWWWLLRVRASLTPKIDLTMETWRTVFLWFLIGYVVMNVGYIGPRMRQNAPQTIKFYRRWEVYRVVQWLGHKSNMCLLFVSLLTRKRVYCYAWNYVDLLMDHSCVYILCLSNRTEHEARRVLFSTQICTWPLSSTDPSCLNWAIIKAKPLHLLTQNCRHGLTVAGRVGCENTLRSFAVAYQF